MLHDQDLISIQEVRAKVDKAYNAFLKYRTYSQQQVDAIVEAMAAAGRANALKLAQMAVEETGYGNVKDKLAKNLLCADLLSRSIQGMKTRGVLRELPEQKVVEYGEPMGVVAAIAPTTNPTSTAIYKSIISLKAGNSVVISPHPRSKNSTCYTADLLCRAAVDAGAPEDIIQCLASPTTEGTTALMRHDRVAVILATGGSGMVKAAYSSGKPAFGVGPGNVPVLLEKSADVPDAVAKVVIGKSFDYGTVCSSEQNLITCRALRDAVLAELRKNRAFLCNDEQKQALAKVLFTSSGGISPRCVGQSPQKLAKLAGFSVPEDAAILVVEIEGVGKFHPLSAEKLSPVLAVCFVEDFEAAMKACEEILRFGGLGHTCVIFSKDEARIREFAGRMPAFRVLVNTSAPQGSVGITTSLQPSMTLGCGAMGGNSTGDNVGPQHLINVKRLAYWIRRPEDALDIPEAPGEQKPAQPPREPVDRQAVAAAVEQYLAERGIPAPAAAAVSAGTVASISAQVVDRFLSARLSNPAPAACPVACPEKAKPAEAPKPAEPAPPQPAVEIVDFVCESDVRAALQQGRKIYIGPKSIVTPAARELAAQHDTLVEARR